jgi:hypothetical protein
MLHTMAAIANFSLVVDTLAAAIADYLIMRRRICSPETATQNAWL